MKTSPTQRSLKLLRKAGYLCAITEKWNPHVKIRQDMFGFVDILAIRGNEVLAVQTTTGDHAAERVEKIMALPATQTWLSSATRRIIVHGWRTVGKRGERKLWVCRQIEVFTCGAKTLEHELKL